MIRKNVLLCLCIAVLMSCAQEPIRPSQDDDGGFQPSSDAGLLESVIGAMPIVSGLSEVISSVYDRYELRKKFVSDINDNSLINILDTIDFDVGDRRFLRSIKKIRLRHGILLEDFLLGIEDNPSPFLVTKYPVVKDLNRKDLHMIANSYVKELKIMQVEDSIKANRVFFMNRLVGRVNQARRMIADEERKCLELLEDQYPDRKLFLRFLLANCVIRDQITEDDIRNDKLDYIFHTLGFHNLDYHTVSVLKQIFECIELSKDKRYEKLNENFLLSSYKITYMLREALDEIMDERLMFLQEDDNAEAAVAKIGAIDSLLKQMINERNRMPSHAIARCLEDLAGMFEERHPLVGYAFVNFMGYFMQTSDNMRKLLFDIKDLLEPEYEEM
ncbi:hypothetical protein [Borrelia persica]|uniref:hypothetical protein n=1 Tax=Borrelia persica TaxID=44448 RepID=UPI000464A227|nr:hypothetical protein [Borrelia persica]